MTTSPHLETLNALLASTQVSVYALDLQGRYLFANRAFAEVTGQASQDSLIGQPREAFLPPERVRQQREFDQRIVATGEPLTIEESAVVAGKGLRQYLVQKFPLRDADGSIYAIASIATDITEHQHLDRELRLAAMVFSASTEAILITDSERRILQVNPRFTDITGYTAEEVVGRTPAVLSSGMQDEAYYRSMWQTIASQGSWSGEITNRRKDGSLYPEWLSITAVHDAQGDVVNYIGLFSDLTQRKMAEARMQQLINYDSLTSLPNRTLFLDRLEQALRNAQRSEEGVAVFWIDLLRFRVINDSYGHSMGDIVLAEIGHRISQIVRVADTVARLAADEYGVLMVGYEHENDIVQMAQRLLEAIGQPLTLAGSICNVAANIGIGIYRKDGEDAEALLKAADVALMRAKQAGRNTFNFFAPGMNIEAERRLRLEADLREALANNNLAMHYQPQINLATGRINAIEALMRWQHPDLGNIEPLEFIPIAEETGLITSMGAWAIRCACAQNKAWIDAGVLPVPIAVNLSAKQFQQVDITEIIANALKDTGLPAHLLELEFTESAFSADIQGAMAIVKRIRELGVSLVLDDFGNGYASLTALSDFPFNKIKIDRTFVRDITTNPVNAAIATASIAMARSLNLIILAEGVESEAQMNFLRARQCEAMQGHLFSKPLPADELTELLLAQRQMKVSPCDTAPQQTILLVDDEANILNALKRVLRREGYQILTAESPDIAFDLLARHDVQVIISDQRMPGMSGTEFLERAKLLYPQTVRIILSGYTDLASITDAINRGAIYHFLTKPWEDEKLRTEVREAFRVAQGFARA